MVTIICKLKTRTVEFEPRMNVSSDYCTVNIQIHTRQLITVTIRCYSKMKVFWSEFQAMIWKLDDFLKAIHTIFCRKLIVWPFDFKTLFHDLNTGLRISVFRYSQQFWVVQNPVHFMDYEPGCIYVHRQGSGCFRLRRLEYWQLFEQLRCASNWQYQLKDLSAKNKAG
jgi:hypothetical protein